MFGLEGPISCVQFFCQQVQKLILLTVQHILTNQSINKMNALPEDCMSAYLYDFSEAPQEA